ncbi:hypothetical protein F4814DRAFT_454508 [Daldinia grandis]|nr:hypothetical protein F4814DRAFT_454508 [Daldinia grandis]
MASSSNNMDIYTKEKDGQMYLVGPGNEEMPFEYDITQIPRDFQSYYRDQAALRSAGTTTDVQGVTGALSAHDEDSGSDEDLESDSALEAGDDLDGDGDPNGHANAVSAAPVAPVAPMAPMAPVIPAGVGAMPGPVVGAMVAGPVAGAMPAGLVAGAMPVAVPVAAVPQPCSLAQLRAVVYMESWMCPFCNSGAADWRRHLASHVTECGWPGCGQSDFCTHRAVATHIDHVHGTQPGVCPFPRCLKGPFKRADIYYAHVCRHCIFG